MAEYTLQRGPSGTEINFSTSDQVNMVTVSRSERDAPTEYKTIPIGKAHKEWHKLQKQGFTQVRDNNG